MFLGSFAAGNPGLTSVDCAGAGDALDEEDDDGGDASGTLALVLGALLLVIIVEQLPQTSKIRFIRVSILAI